MGVCLITPKLHILPRELIFKFKAIVLEEGIIEFSIMEPPAIKWRTGEGKCRGNHTAINRKQLNTLTSPMEGLQMRHVNLTLKVAFSCEIYFNRLPLSPLRRGKNAQLFAQATSSSHSPKYRAFFFLNISLKLKLNADTLLQR